MKVLQVYGVNPMDVSEMIDGAETTDVRVEDVMNVEEKYDIVFCWHALQVMQGNVAPTIVQKMVDLLNVHGELWLIVPDFDWIAQQMASNNPSPVTMQVLFGDDTIPYRSTYTLAFLRALVEECKGMITRTATHDVYALTVTGDRKVQVVQNRVIALKVTDDDTADNAIT